jgi:hypothetical protein
MPHSTNADAAAFFGDTYMRPGSRAPCRFGRTRHASLRIRGDVASRPQRIAHGTNAQWHRRTARRRKRYAMLAAFASFDANACTYFFLRDTSRPRAASQRRGAGRLARSASKRNVVAMQFQPQPLIAGSCAGDAIDMPSKKRDIARAVGRSVINR